jgi:hypothetical protein
MNTFFVPLKISFKPIRFQTTGFTIFDIFVDILFLIDIILMFMTSFLNSKGQQITDRADIAINYMSQKRFTYDLLAIFGTEIFAKKNPIFAFFGLFKLTRIGRLSEFVQKLNIPSHIKSYIMIFKMSLFLTIWIHIQACIWY